MPEDSPRVGVVGVAGGWSTEALADAVAERTGNRLVVDMAKVTLDATTGAVEYADQDLRELDGLILKKMGESYGPGMLDRIDILRYLAEHVPTFSQPDRVRPLIDRLSCTVRLLQADVPMPPTVVTEDVDAAVAKVRAFGRAVLKPLYSTKARGMTVIDAAAGEDPEPALRAFQEAGNPVLYIQKMVDLPDRDLGLAFLAGEHIGTYARVRTTESWNTTTEDGGKYAAHQASEQLIELARHAQAPFGLDFTVVDLAETRHGPVVFEVSAFGGFRGLQTALGIDVAGMYADYVLQRIGHG